jgi:hypothetical protein
VKVNNVQAFALALPVGATRQDVAVTVNGQKLQTRPYQKLNGQLSIYLMQGKGGWKSVLPEKLTIDQLRSPQKVAGMQGPIDDAFTGPFLCVRGTGDPWHDAVQKYADARLEQFQDEWSKYFRGALPVKDDVDVTAEDIATRHLILFGDPSSNSLMEQVISSLPLKWTKDTLAMGGKTYDTGNHLPAMVYPSPLNGHRYVVINSGHTFGAADLAGTNALLYPRLGDRAVLKLQPDRGPLAAEVVRSELLNDYWQPASPP